MAAEAERIIESDIHFGLAGFFRHVIHLKVAAFVLIIEIDGRGDDWFGDGLYAYYKFHRAACAQQMTQTAFVKIMLVYTAKWLKSKKN